MTLSRSTDVGLLETAGSWGLKVDNNIHYRKLTRGASRVIARKRDITVDEIRPPPASAG